LHICKKNCEKYDYPDTKALLLVRLLGCPKGALFFVGPQRTILAEARNVIKNNIGLSTGRLQPDLAN